MHRVPLAVTVLTVVALSTTTLAAPRRKRELDLQSVNNVNAARSLQGPNLDRIRRADFRIHDPSLSNGPPVRRSLGDYSGSDKAEVIDSSRHSTYHAHYSENDETEYLDSYDEFNYDTNAHEHNQETSGGAIYNDNTADGEHKQQEWSDETQVHESKLQSYNIAQSKINQENNNNPDFSNKTNPMYVKPFRINFVEHVRQGNDASSAIDNNNTAHSGYKIHVSSHKTQDHESHFKQNNDAQTQRPDKENSDIPDFDTSTIHDVENPQQDNKETQSQEPHREPNILGGANSNDNTEDSEHPQHESSDERQVYASISKKKNDVQTKTNQENNKNPDFSNKATFNTNPIYVKPCVIHFVEQMRQGNDASDPQQNNGAQTQRPDKENSDYPDFETSTIHDVENPQQDNKETQSQEPYREPDILGGANRNDNTGDSKHPQHESSDERQEHESDPKQNNGAQTQRPDKENSDNPDFETSTIHDVETPQQDNKETQSYESYREPNILGGANSNDNTGDSKHPQHELSDERQDHESDPERTDQENNKYEGALNTFLNLHAQATKSDRNKSNNSISCNSNLDIWPFTRRLFNLRIDVNSFLIALFFQVDCTEEKNTY